MSAGVAVWNMVQLTIFTFAKIHEYNVQIRHYAKAVTYDAEHFLTKNKGNMAYACGYNFFALAFAYTHQL